MPKIVHYKKDKDKEKCNCVCETVLGFLYWAVGCSEGVMLGGVCGCYEMGGRYDFSSMDEWFQYGLRTGYADGFMFGNL
jgi:hypothetical protein